MTQEQMRLKEQIETLVREYYEKFHQKKDFAPGDRVPYSGRVYDAEDRKSVV